MRLRNFVELLKWQYLSLRICKNVRVWTVSDELPGSVTKGSCQYESRRGTPPVTMDYTPSHAFAQGYVYTMAEARSSKPLNFSKIIQQTSPCMTLGRGSRNDLERKHVNVCDQILPPCAPYTLSIIFALLSWVSILPYRTHVDYSNIDRTLGIRMMSCA